MQRGLVLAGGGVAGIAWLVGAIEALRDGGIDLGDADLVVGTSAGAAVGAQLANDQLAASIALQERADSAEIFADLDLTQLLAKSAEMARGARDEREILRRFGAYALTASAIPEPARRAAVAARLTATTWPARPLRITAVDTATGDLVVFDRSSGASLVDAVTASCAVPGVWPPATIGARRFMDGGARSFTNADVARGCERVLIVIPAAGSPLHSARLAREREALQNSCVVEVDDDAIAAIGPNPLDPSRRRQALAAGRRQGRALCEELAGFWNG